MEQEQKTRPACDTKVCASCGRELPLESFQYNTKGERISVCKRCMTERRRAGKAKKKDERPITRESLTKEEVAEIFTYLTDADLAAELRRRGYSGTLTKHTELNV